VYHKVTHLIPWENTYNMDESNFANVEEESTRIIINKQASKTRYKAHPGWQEWVSVMECIYTDRLTVPPCFFFKSESVNSDVVADKIPGDWCISNSPKG
jgi:hypothetical protein